MSESVTRDSLLDAAQALVQRVGANAMSYQDLSEAVGIRKASIHYHFPTKSDLLVSLIARYADHFLGVLGEIRSSKATGSSKLARYCRLFEQTLRKSAGERACPCGMLGAEVTTLSPEAGKELRAFYNENARGLAAILDDGLHDGSLAFEGRSDDLAWLLFSMLEGAMLVARVEGGVGRFTRILRQFETLITP
jgi:TetR/AcrR family transcriptional repressor of nem operon